MAPAPRTTLLQNITRFDASQLAPWMAARNAMGVAIALLAGLALNNLAGGMIASSGALSAAFSDGSDPYPHRARRMLAATCFVALAVFAGRLCGEYPALVIAIQAVCALAVGMMVAVSQPAADIGTITLVELIVFSAQPAPPGIAFTSGLLALAGGCLQTVLSVLFWPVRRFAAEARALSALYSGLAVAARSGASATQAPPVTDAVLAARAALAGLGESRSLESERYLALFSQAERIRLGLLTLSRLRNRMARESAGAEDAALLSHGMEIAAKLLASVAGALSAGVAAKPQEDCLRVLRELSEHLRQPRSEPGLTAMRSDARWQVDALAGQLRMATDLAARTTVAGLEEFRRRESAKPWYLRVAGTAAVLRANLNPRASVFRHAVRLAGCVALAGLAGRTLHTHRVYWAPMTAAIVLKPDFTATLSRGVLRLIGTFTGLAVATTLFALLSPSPPLQIVLITLFMFAMRWAGGANYGVLVTALTGLVVLLFGITGVPPAEVAPARAMNTVIGGVIALAANRFWPTWERTLINEALARLFDSYREYFQAVRDGYIHPGIEHDRDYRLRLDRVRQAGRLGRTNLEASVARYRVEPGALADRVTLLQEILANSHRFINAVMALEAALLGSEAAPPRAEFAQYANQVDITLYFLSAYLRGAAMAPGDLPDLREAHRALAGEDAAGIERYALANVETDRVTNSLNTLSLEVVQWMGTGLGDGG